MFKKTRPRLISQSSALRHDSIVLSITPVCSHGCVYKSHSVNFTCGVVKINSYRKQLELYRAVAMLFIDVDYPVSTKAIQLSMFNHHTRTLYRVPEDSNFIQIRFNPANCNFIYQYKSDVWLAVHRNSVWIRKTN